jgi:outer membrane protein assembly factor BamA
MEQLRIRFFLPFFIFIWCAFWIDNASAQSKVCAIEMIDYAQQLPRLDLFMPTEQKIKQCIIEGDMAGIDDLESVIAIPQNSAVTASQLKQIVAHLFHKNKFRTITFTIDDDALLHINFESMWTFDRLKIGGIALGKDMYRHSYLFQPGQPFDEGRHIYSCNAIQQKLKDEGYCAATVESKLERDNYRKMITVYLTINKGPLYTIATTAIMGVIDIIVQHWLDNYYKQLQGKAYTQEAIQAALNQARLYLEKNGYYVVKNNVHHHKNPHTATVTLTFSYQLSNKRLFTFEGNAFFSDVQLRERLLRFGAAAWLLPAESLVQELKRMYHDSFFADVHIAVHEEGEHLFFTIHEGEQALRDTSSMLLRTNGKNKNSKEGYSSVSSEQSREDKSNCILPFVLRSPLGRLEGSNTIFGKTIIQNHSTIPTYMIRRELAYQEGDCWCQEQINESLTNLKALEVFDRVRLYPVENSPDQKTMLLSVHADDPYELRLRAGMGLQQMSKNFMFNGISYVAGGSFIVKNPFNHADQFRIEAEYTHGEQSLWMQYIRPWLWNMPVKANFEIYIMQYLQPGLRHNQKNIYSFIQQGFLIGLNHRRDIIDAQLNLGVEWMETKTVCLKHIPWEERQHIARALNFEPFLVDKKIPYAQIEPSIVFDQLDNKLNPCCGSLSLFTAKGMFPVRLLALNSFFVRMFMDQSVYIPIQQAVLALRGRVGHIFCHDFKNVMPAERFYLGGANSIRSYETDLCPPLGTLHTKEGKILFVPQGARSMFTLNIELRVPVYKKIWCALFQDIGALSNNHFADIKAQSILAGTGFGVRIATPIGPLRFDIAWKWHRPDPAIPGYCWFLSFGNAF